MNVAITCDMVLAMRLAVEQPRTMATARDCTRGGSTQPQTNLQAMSAVKLGANVAPSAPPT